MRIRSGYSFNTAYGHLPAVFKRAVFDGVAPLTDRASTFGWNPWAKLAKTNNVRPIYGLELAVSTNPFAKKDRDIDYWTFVAKTDLKPLNELLRLATANSRGEPVISYRQAIEAEGVFKIVGGQGPISEMAWFAKLDDVYVALSPSLSTYAYRTYREMGTKFVLSNDNYYPDPDDHHEYALAIGRNASSQTWPQHIMSRGELAFHLMDQFVDPHDMLGAENHLFDIVKGSTAELKKGHLVEPIGVQRPLLDECIQGAEKLGVNLEAPGYLERLGYELKLIKEKGYEDYFHIVGDLVRWARGQMLVGPARGSSCGSLVCFLLGITTVDPIPYGLLFERFIDINRSDLPDIDIDFSDQHRGRVFEYLRDKYGAKRVARIGTVQFFKHRSALQVGGAAYKVPKWRIDALADIVEPRAAGDARANLSLTDAFEMLPVGKKLVADFPDMARTAKLEGHPKHYSQHAAGVIITDKPVIDYVAIDSRSGATQCDMRDAEAMNLLKIDALGLTQLSIFEDAFELIKTPVSALFDLSLDDLAAFEVFNRGDFLGIFQFNGKALQGITRQVTVKSFDDIVSITALARPGPINSGATQTWIERKKGGQVLSVHPLFDPILAPTLGVIVYQEQIMQMCRAVGMEWSDVIAVRKAMGKSQGLEAMKKWQDKFVAGCSNHGIPPSFSERLWMGMCEFGAYAFNKSHSVAYAVISYWCAWMKAYHPTAFAAATLTHERDDDKQIAMLRELERNGIHYKPFDIKHSTNKWTVAVEGNSRTLIGPVSNVIGVGPVGQSEFLAYRTNPILFPMSSRTSKMISAGKTKLDTLWPIRDAAKPLVEAQFAIKSVPIPIEAINDPTYETGFGSIMVVAQIDKMTIKNENDEASVAKRGRKIDGDLTTSLNLWLRDDTGTVFAKIDRLNYEKLGKEMVDRGGAGKALYALRGTVRGGEFRMLNVQKVLYLGERK